MTNFSCKLGDALPYRILPKTMASYIGGNRQVLIFRCGLYHPIMTIPGEAISNREGNKRQLAGHDTWVRRGQGSPVPICLLTLQLGQL